MRRAIIVIEAADRDAANIDAAMVDLIGGNLTFTVGLVSAANQTGPITHYWCSWWVTDAEWDALEVLFGVGNTLGRRMFDGAVWTPDAVLAETGLVRQPADV